MLVLKTALRLSPPPAAARGTEGADKLFSCCLPGSESYAKVWLGLIAGTLASFVRGAGAYQADLAALFARHADGIGVEDFRQDGMPIIGLPRWMGRPLFERLVRKGAAPAAPASAPPPPLDENARLLQADFMQSGSTPCARLPIACSALPVAHTVRAPSYFSLTDAIISASCLCPPHFVVGPLCPRRFYESTLQDVDEQARFFRIVKSPRRDYIAKEDWVPFLHCLCPPVMHKTSACPSPGG